MMLTEPITATIETIVPFAPLGPLAEVTDNEWRGTPS